MTDGFMRHFIAACGTVIVLLAFFSGYFAGKSGWWWVSFGVIVIYATIYKLVRAGHH